jgi:GNAT superfamily N-acetyltransferase
MMKKTPAVRIRPAASGDLEAIARVQARTMVAAAHYPDCLDESSECRRLLPRVAGYFAGTYGPQCSLPERAIFIAEHGGEVVGFIAGHRATRRGCTAELEWAFVLPAWQRQGVGGRLLGPLTDWFIAQRSTRVIVDAPPANPCRAFYLKHGATPLDGHWLYWADISGVNDPMKPETPDGNHRR